MPARVTVTAEGREWTAEELAERCRIGCSAARRRMRMYRAGAIDRETLLHVGKRHLGGHPGGKSSESRPTVEWLALDDSRRSMAAIDTTPGKWEREHLRPAEGKTAARRYVLAEGRRCGERREIYYNPVRVAL
ncbi:MAG: hypothetical protein PHH57_06380 [Candidatus Omnitrophica bacterium]|jgi:hypothetical protein|nr:hypothetical protein [Candidatus Omnitrophota bacterium]